MVVAQVVLTTAESRKLIAHVISQMQPVRNALQRFKLIISTSFIAPDILGALGYEPIATQDRGLYVCGMVRAEGLCATDPARSKRPTILERGVVVEDTEARMKAILSLGAGDVYIKSPNILDRNGRVGVLAGAVDCGEVGGIIWGLKKQDFSIIAPTLLLKSAPIDLTALSEVVDANTYRRHASSFIQYSCGMPVNLVPLPERTTVITEIDAIRMVFDLVSKPIAMSGVGTGADAIVLSVEGAEEKIERFWDYICRIKGSPAPPVYPADCQKCPLSKDPTSCGRYLAPTGI
ncbi:MAG: hypothetical protein ACXACI_06010 [Candidatus Hodarchaeales archaeon]|jgi:hypothetical protein